MQIALRPLIEFCWLGIFPWIKLAWDSCSVWIKLSSLTNLDDSTFSVTGYLPLIRKGPSIHMHDLAVYVKEGLHFAWEWDLAPENSADSYFCFWLVLLHSVSYFFFLYRSPLSLCMVFDFISSNIDEVVSINPSANVFVFGRH